MTAETVQLATGADTVNRVDGAKQAAGQGSAHPDDIRAAYAAVCKGYADIDGFRMGLLGFLPLGSLASIFILSRDANLSPFQGLIGLFGFAVTLGLLLFEVYGIRKCHALIVTGRKLERQMNLPGQFTCRPRSVAKVINEPFASGVIYPAVLGAWAFVALNPIALWVSIVAALVAFAAGFVAMLRYNLSFPGFQPPADCYDV